MALRNVEEICPAPLKPDPTGMSESACKVGRRPRITHTVEQIITKLREAEVVLGTDHPVVQVCRTLRITEQIFYSRGKEYGGFRVEHAKLLKELKRENCR